MAIESIPIQIGAKMPAFSIADPFGKMFNSRELSGQKGLLVVFTCNHCPYALAIWPRLINLAKLFRPQGINTITINPNIHPDYPADAPEKMKEKITEWQLPFPYLVDETQDVARQFQAKCTPDIYLYDHAGFLVYHGQLDDNWKEPEKVRRQELKDAMENLVLGKPPLENQNPAIGCAIKWRL